MALGHQGFFGGFTGAASSCSWRWGFVESRLGFGQVGLLSATIWIVFPRLVGQIVCVICFALYLITSTHTLVEHWIAKLSLSRG